MPEHDDETLEVKISAGFIQRLLKHWSSKWFAFVSLAFAAGGGAGTYLAPTASAQSIAQAATTAAEKAVLKERELTDAKIGAIKEDIDELKDDVKSGNREQRALLTDVLLRLPRDPVSR